jgi:hypothetical protein
MSFSPQIPSPLPSLKPILDAALIEYKKKTGKELLDQPLARVATDVQRCDTVDAALAILRDQAKAFQQLKDGDQKFMERIGLLTQVLFAFSGTLGVGDFGLVILIRRDFKYTLTLLHRSSPLRKQSLLPSLPFLVSVISPLFGFPWTLLMMLKFIVSKRCDGEPQGACRPLRAHWELLQTPRGLYPSFVHHRNGRSICEDHGRGTFYPLHCDEGGKTMASK